MMAATAAKTTLTFTPAFRERLRLYSQSENKSMSRFVEEELSQVLEKHENAKLKRMYAAIRKAEGSGSPGIRDASLTINETLYGDEGAWKGQNE